MLLGRTGRGKTHLAIAIAYKAIQNGFDARFETAPALLGRLHKAQQAGALDEAMAQYVDPHVLVIDELGYLTYGSDAANFLFQVVDQRYLARRPVLIALNKEPSEWGRVLHDADLAEAIIYRLPERGEILRLAGKSYRQPHVDSVPSDAGACPVLSCRDLPRQQSRSRPIPATVRLHNGNAQEKGYPRLTVLRSRSTSRGS